MAAGKSSSHLLGNSAWNASAFLVGVGLNLLILPFVLFRLGAATFGVAGLVAACIAPALAFSNFDRANRRRGSWPVVCLWASAIEARRFFATALLLAAAAGLLIAMLPSRWPAQAACPPCVQSGQGSCRRSGVCISARRRRMAVPVHLGGVSGAVHRAPGLCAAGFDQRREHGGLDRIDVAADPALAAGIDVSRLSGTGLCHRPCGVIRGFPPHGR